MKDDCSFWHGECEDHVGHLKEEAQQALKLLKLERDQGWRYRIWVSSAYRQLELSRQKDWRWAEEGTRAMGR